MYHTTQQITHAPALTPEPQIYIVPCFLKDQQTQKDVCVFVLESGRKVEWKRINTYGVPRAEFDDIQADVREYVGKMGFDEFTGLFTIELK